MNPLSRWTLPNGLAVLYQLDPSFPLTSASLLFSAGSRWEASHQAGLSSMTVDLLMQGTRKRSARAIARVMESVGASMGTQAHEDYAEMAFIVPAKESPRALDVMTDVLREPAFPADEISKERSHILAGLKSRKDAIFHLAYDHLNRAMYGDHPYGRPLEGNMESVRRFKRADFTRWNDSHNTPQGAILSLVGPDAPERIHSLLKRTLAQWDLRSSKAKVKSAIDEAPLLKKSKTVSVTSPFEQAYLMVGFQAPTAYEENQLVMKVLNTLLGGGMSSRLFMTLREELGLAYEVSSFYPTRLDKSQWVIYLGLPAERLPVASRRLDDLLEKLADEGPKESELRQSKAMIRGAFLMDRQSRRRQGWYNAWWEFLGRGPHYGEEFLRAVDAVSLKAVRDQLRRILKQPRITVKVVPNKHGQSR
jgi:zinc protease